MPKDDQVALRHHHRGKPIPYWQLFYHITWATKNRQPLLTPRVEPVIHGYAQTKATGLGATVFALDGTQDHVHVIAAIQPRDHILGLSLGSLAAGMLLCLLYRVKQKPRPAKE